jgi:hypothetical protein
MRIFALYFMALALLFGCASAKPAAKAGPAPAPDAYLTAEGLGSTEGEARNQARAELSRIFEARVYSEARDRISAVVESSEDATTETTRQQIESRVRVVSDVKLVGVEVGEAWPQGGLYHALAMLDRRKARDSWASEVEDIDQKITSLLGTLGSLRGRLLKYRALRAAADLWVQREVLVSRLRVLGFYSGPPSGYDVAEVFRKTAEIKSSMPVYIEVVGEHAHALKGPLLKALGLAGYVMAEKPDAASVVITGTVLVEPVDLENPRLRYARASLTLAITDAEAGLSVGEVTEKQRGAHITYREAVDRALKKISESGPAELVRGLAGLPCPEECPASP